MIISVYGAGYVGLVSAVCFSKMGYDVICADINQHKISLLQQGQSPIHEVGLPELLNTQLQQGRLQFTTNLCDAIQQASIHVIATGTPSLPDGSADLSQVFAVVEKIARYVTCEGLVVIKSTVPPGTGDLVETYLDKERLRWNNPCSINVASNPEFLREGRAVYDFLHADRIVVGGNAQAIMALKALYQPLTEEGIPLIVMSRQSAELTKYAANAMLACKISFINQMSRIAEKVGANIDEVRTGIGSDSRIGPHFLEAGIGYGGSCFPKDGRALLQMAQSLDIDVPLLQAIEASNALQKTWVMEQLKRHFKDGLENKTIGLWGLSFKPETDDIREASSLVIIQSLLPAKVHLRLYDPVAMPMAKNYVSEHPQIIWCDSADDVLSVPLDALVIATEWPLFKTYSLARLRAALGHAPLIDGRNCFELSAVKQAEIAYYYSVGRPLIRLC